MAQVRIVVGEDCDWNTEGLINFEEDWDIEFYLPVVRAGSVRSWLTDQILLFNVRHRSREGGLRWCLHQTARSVVITPATAHFDGFLCCWNGERIGLLSRDGVRSCGVSWNAISLLVV